MNTPNPFIPQGSLLEQRNRKRTRFQVAVYVIFAFNILVIAPLIVQGCRRENSTDNGTTTGGQPADTSATVQQPVADPNVSTAQLPPPATNPVIQQQVPPVNNQMPPQVPPPQAATEYVIIKGDTLDSIHKKFGVTVKAIEEANPGIVPTKLQQGHKLQIPAPTMVASNSNGTAMSADGSEMYMVKSGDTLSKIATGHSTTVKAIETLNNLKTTKIRVGDKLKMPPPKATPPPAAAPAATTTTPAAPTTPPAQ